MLASEVWGGKPQPSTPELVAARATTLPASRDKCSLKGKGWRDFCKEAARVQGHNQPEVTSWQDRLPWLLSPPSSDLLQGTPPTGPPQPEAAAWDLSVQPRQHPATQRRANREGKWKQAGTTDVKGAAGDLRLESEQR